MSDEDEAGADEAGQSDDLDSGTGGPDGDDAGEESTAVGESDQSEAADGVEESGGFEEVDDLFAGVEEPSGDLEDLFTEVETSDVDAGAVWDALGGDGRRPVRSGASAPLGEPSATDEAVVTKASYCQGCEHFSAPPEMHCDNPGTDILELVDVRHVRVRNCPVVERRRSPTVARLETEADDGDDQGGDAASTAGERSRRSNEGS